LTGEDLVTLNEEIAGMAKAGLPLDQGLRALADEMGHGRLQRVTESLSEDLRAGLTLPQALDRQRGRVPPFYSALLAAGIRSGRLGEVLGTLTMYSRSIAEFRQTVTSALIYPTIVFVLGLSLMAFMSIEILPKFDKIYGDFKLRLPAFTSALLFVGRHPWEILVAPLVGVIVAILIVRTLARSTASGRLLWSRMVYALPLFGTLIRAPRLAAFADLFGILVDQSVPLPEAFRLAATASSDPLLRRGGEQVERDLRQGIPLGVSLSGKKLVPELVVWMIQFGEKQGTLGPALHQVAEVYRRQGERRAALLRVLLPPFLIVAVAVVIGGAFVIGLMAPLLQLLQGLSGGKW
jgi:type II secretory pathway component PulF